MLDTFDAVTDWSAVAQCTAPSLDTTTFIQGTGAMKFSKNGTGAASGYVQRKLKIPIDVQTARSMPSAVVKMRLNHANFTNVSSIDVILCYRFDTSGAADVTETFRISSFAGGWNTLSVALKAPTADSGNMSDERRSHCIAYKIGVNMAAAANTLTDLIVDALEIVSSDSSVAPLSAIEIDGHRLVGPPFNIWNEQVPEQKRVNEAPQAVETVFLSRAVGIQAGWEQVRAVHRAQSKVHTFEESLQRAAQYMAANQGWSLAYPAGELINTTLDGVVTAGALSIVVASATEFTFLGLTSTLEAAIADIRLGPNASRQFECNRAIAISGTTVYLDRPVRFSYETGKAVRSAGYYPNLALNEGEFPLKRTGKNVSFEINAREAA